MSVIIEVGSDRKRYTRRAPEYAKLLTGCDNLHHRVKINKNIEIDNECRLSSENKAHLHANSGQNIGPTVQ